MTDSGAVAVDTGIFTGRSPRDKYIVRDEQTRDAPSGGQTPASVAMTTNRYRQTVAQPEKGLVAGQLSGKNLYVIDAWCGASPDTRLGVRFVIEVAWQAHFVKNMFIVPSDEADRLYARLRGAQRRGLHQCQLAGAGDELRELCRL
ncbi:phosphoenolpyruvate carboxykinase (ATP) [Klebsiella pneumoniae subsp. pneumoniae]|nr:phosphoenolpyruvate carboxykinase (ATP) [Klebsiella pneumoniae subsp. pneumoniae]